MKLNDGKFWLVQDADDDADRVDGPINFFKLAEVIRGAGPRSSFSRVNTAVYDNQSEAEADAKKRAGAKKASSYDYDRS